MATGGGKTIVLAHLLDEVLAPGESALVLAHRQELLDQARDKLALAAPSLSVEVEQAERRADRGISFFTGGKRRVVVASVQTLRGKRLESWARDAFRYVVVDEAHHATAKSYQDVLTHFGCFDPARRVPCLGVTATARRSDKVGLGDVFQEISAEVGMAPLVKAGFLARLQAYRVTTDVELRGVKVVAGDFAAGELEERVNTDQRNHDIVAAHRKWANGVKALAFCAGVEHAKALAEDFVDAGVTAEAIWGAMPAEDRKETLARFKSGETLVLTNFSVLLEGYDEPSISCVILARPTKSSLLLTQMIGRGTRVHEGKPHLVVLDVRDITRETRIETVASLAGLPPAWKLAQGEDVFASSEALAELPEEARWRAGSAADIVSIANRAAAAKTAYRTAAERLAERMEAERVDLLAACEPDPVVKENSSFAWYATGPQSYAIALVGVRYAIQADALGAWNATRHERDVATQRLGSAQNEADAFALADASIRAEKQGFIADRKASWRKNLASEKQRTVISRAGIEIPGHLTSGQASVIIARIFQERGWHGSARRAG